MRFFVFFLLFAISVFAAPARIVTLSPAVNEMVFALGAGDSVVATTNYANYPPKAKTLAKVGGYHNVSLEKVLSFSPTLVATEASGAALTAKLTALGIDTFSARIDSLQSIKTAFSKLGAKLSRQKEAAAINEKIDKSISALAAMPRTDKKALIVFGNNIDLTKNVYVAGSNLYFAELIEKMGFKNAVQRDKSVQPVLGIEGIAACNPDIVFVLFPYTKEKNITAAQIKEAWGKLPIKAAKSGAIYVFENDYVSIPSDRIAIFADDLRKALESYHARHR